MKKIFIVHGFGGIPNGGWISWIMQQLSKEKVYTCSLPMPTPKNPIVSKWIEEISRAVENSPEDEIFLVGHSLGATAVLKYLENLPENNKIKGVILVSGLISPLDPLNKESNFRAIDSFVVPSIDFRKIKNKSEKFVVLHSIDDPIVPFAHAKEISQNLSCELIETEQGGHFYILAEPVRYELEPLLSILEKMIH